MEVSLLVVLGVVGLIVLPFILAVLVFRPLIISISDRIAGRKGGMQEIKDLKHKVYILENEMADLRGKLMALEDSQHFHKSLEDDIEKRIKRD